MATTTRKTTTTIDGSPQRRTQIIDTVPEEIDLSSPIAANAAPLSSTDLQGYFRAGGPVPQSHINQTYNSVAHNPRRRRKSSVSSSGSTAATLALRSTTEPPMLTKPPLYVQADDIIDESPIFVGEVDAARDNLRQLAGNVPPLSKEGQAADIGSCAVLSLSNQQRQLAAGTTTAATERESGGSSSQWRVRNTTSASCRDLGSATSYGVVRDEIATPVGEGTLITRGDLSSATALLEYDAMLGSVSDASAEEVIDETLDDPSTQCYDDDDYEDDGEEEEAADEDVGEEGKGSPLIQSPLGRGVKKAKLPISPVCKISSTFDIVIVGEETESC